MRWLGDVLLHEQREGAIRERKRAKLKSTTKEGGWREETRMEDGGEEHTPVPAGMNKTTGGSMRSERMEFPPHNRDELAYTTRVSDICGRGVRTEMFKTPPRARAHTHAHCHSHFDAEFGGDGEKREDSAEAPELQVTFLRGRS